MRERERATLPSRGPFNGISVCSSSKREILNFATKKFVYPRRVVFLEADDDDGCISVAVPLFKDPRYNRGETRVRDRPPPPSL